MNIFPKAFILLTLVLISIAGCTTLNEQESMPDIKLVKYPENLESHIKDPDFMCTTDIEFSCSKKGCTDNHPYFYFSYKTSGYGDDLVKKGIYERCDEKGCNSFDVIEQNSGNYLYLIDPYNASFNFKKDTSYDEFVETASFGTDQLIKYGNCFKDRIIPEYKLNIYPSGKLQILKNGEIYDENHMTDLKVTKKDQNFEILCQNGEKLCPFLICLDYPIPEKEQSTYYFKCK